jgi:hypothetical protein
MKAAAGSDLFHKPAFELHGTEAVDFAINVVVAFNQTNVLDLGAHFDPAEEPLIFKSLTKVTVSPSCSTLPFASFQTLAASEGVVSPGFHSWPQLGQISRSPSG